VGAIQDSKNSQPSTQKRRKIMKLLVSAVALAALVATPVFAQTTKRAPARVKAQSEQQYPQLRAGNQRHSTNPANDVYDAHGGYLGSDPDATIRGMLLTDQSIGD
jgi:hypothetical protein